MPDLVVGRYTRLRDFIVLVYQQVILQILSYARTVNHEGNPMRFKLILRSNAGAEQYRGSAGVGQSKLTEI